MILKVGWHLLTGIQTSLQLSVCDVACHDDRSLEVYTGRNRIFRQFCANSVDTLVEIDLYTLATFTRTAILLRYQLCGVVIHLLQPDTIFVDLCLDVTVGRTAHTHTNGAGSAMTWQTDHADIMSQVLSSELCTQSDLMCLEQQFLLKIDITEGTTGLVACGRQVVVVLDGSELHGEQVLLC